MPVSGQCFLQPGISISLVGNPTPEFVRDLCSYATEFVERSVNSFRSLARQEAMEKKRLAEETWAARLPGTACELLDISTSLQNLIDGFEHNRGDFDAPDVEMGFEMEEFAELLKGISANARKEIRKKTWRDIEALSRYFSELPKYDPDLTEEQRAKRSADLEEREKTWISKANRMIRTLETTASDLWRRAADAAEG
jgi:hypothetical protein